MDIPGRFRSELAQRQKELFFVNSDFADIADTETIRRNLNRLTQAGTLRRILKGVYEKPEYSEMLKEYVAADPEAVAKRWPGTITGRLLPVGIRR